MDCKEKLLRCQNYGDAKKVVETMKISPSGRKLVEIAFANPQSRDVLLNTVIQEQEDGEFNADGPSKSYTDKSKGDKDVEKKIKEEQLVTARDSEGSSTSTLPLPTEGTDGQVTDIKGAEGEDQMKENMMTPPGGGMPQPGSPQGMCPEVAQQMAPQMPQMPQMNTPQMMKQMHYTITEALKPFITKVTRLEEAIIAVDKKVKETSGGFVDRSMKLDIPTGSPKSMMPQSKGIMETELSLAERAQHIRHPSIDLANKRLSIAELDSYLQQNPYQ